MKPLLLLVAFACAASPAPADATEETLTYGRFGTITLDYETPNPGRVVLFVSGDGGWNLGVVEMARQLTTLDALVVGIDITRYLKSLEAEMEPCSYPAGDLEELSKFVQRKLGYPAYKIPILVGYSSGATLVYATLVQAPPNTFLGALSLGFCPDLPLSKPLCPGSGLEWGPGPKGKGYSFRPANHLEEPWIALQGSLDRVCDPAATQGFVARTDHAEIVILPKVGHGYSVPKDWLPQFERAFEKIASWEPADRPAAPTEETKNLPLIEVPSSDTSGTLMAVHITGDGGWGTTDKGIGKELAAAGIPVVGLNALQYFWNARTPEEATDDLGRIMRHYLAAWHKRGVILIGYSFGADVLPILFNRLPPDLAARVRTIALLAPSANATFQFHVIDLIRSHERKDSIPTIPEIDKIRGPKILCFYGEGDKEAICKDLDPARVTSIPIEGGHRIGGRFEAIVRAILGGTG